MKKHTREQKQHSDSSDEKKSRIPRFTSIEEEAAFWDTHSIEDFADELETEDFADELETVTGVRFVIRPVGHLS